MQQSELVLVNKTSRADIESCLPDVLIDLCKVMAQVAVAKFHIGNRLERARCDIKILHPVEQAAYVIELLDNLQCGQPVFLIIWYARRFRCKGSKLVTQYILNRWYGDFLRLTIHFDERTHDVNGVGLVIVTILI